MSIRTLCIVALLLMSVGVRAQEHQSATKPVSAEEAVFRAHVAMTELLLDNPSADELYELGQRYRRREDFARAAVLDLMALRGKPNDPLIEYELACNFSLWGQKKLGAKYLILAAEHGYWGYRVVVEDTDLASLKDTPEFATAVQRIKTNFDSESPKHAPGMTVEAPQGQPPTDGWPVLVFLHGWASQRADFDAEAKFVSTLNFVGITLDATEVMGPGAYTWNRQSVDPTHAQIQAALKKLSVKINPKRVYLQGFSQGATHAARLLADHSDSYAGAICNSPGSPQLMPQKLLDPKATGPLIVSAGNEDLDASREGASKLEALWKAAGRPVKLIRFEGGHQLPPDAEQMFRDAIKQFSEGK